MGHCFPKRAAGRGPFPQAERPFRVASRTVHARKNRRWPRRCRFQVMAGSNRVVSAPRRLNTSIQAGQLQALQAGVASAPAIILTSRDEFPQAICTTEPRSTRQGTAGGIGPWQCEARKAHR